MKMKNTNVKENAKQVEFSGTPGKTTTLETVH
jgi:hypothetical protein